MKKVLLLSTVLLLLFSCKKNSVKKSCCATPPFIGEFPGGKILVPNVFTPDADGVNDLFGPIYVESKITSWEMTITSVKDKELFSTTNSERWDGTSDGNRINDIVGWEITYYTKKAETFSIIGQTCVISDTDGICPNYMEDCIFASQTDLPNETFDPDLPHNELLCVD